MEHKLEILKKLEDLAAEGTLESSVAILNLPSANLCEKRAEMIEVGGRLQQSCNGCINAGVSLRQELGIDKVRQIIDFFAEAYGTRFITINGRGDPFHPRLKNFNLEKIRYAHQKHSMQTYVFTAGNNLDGQTCRMLADTGVNIMMSLFGNRFIDGDFFAERKYPPAPKPLQNPAEIAANLRRLIETYQKNPQQPLEGTTRLGMNYVVSLPDLATHGAQLRELQQAANEHGIFFVCNTNFVPHPDEKTQEHLEQMAIQYSDFHVPHSTFVNGRCQMGAGSSVTVDYDGTILRCPYMDAVQGDGKFQDLSPARIGEVLTGYIHDRKYPCVMRKHQKI